MDIKTLEYLEQRSMKGRELFRKIEHLQKFLNQVKGKSYKTIRLAIDSGSIEITKWGSKQLDLDYETVAEAYMLNAFITITNNEIKLLEEELAEL